MKRLSHLPLLFASLGLALLATACEVEDELLAEVERKVEQVEPAEQATSPVELSGVGADGEAAEGSSQQFPASSGGQARGIVKGLHVSRYGYESLQFKGIPYAAPPVGDLRFKPPQDPAPFDVLEAYEYSARCTQNFWPEDGVTGSEDCLYLNVWTPPTARPGDKKPVMFWIHGGGNGIGSADMGVRELVESVFITLVDEIIAAMMDIINLPFIDKDTYDGHYLAGGRDVIVVSLNYRLGVFGHLAHPSLGEGRGNYSFLDMRKALEWVQTNAANFGGDPGNVTVFGQSAGGWNTCALMNMPSAKGLFHKAIIMSQTCQSRTREQAELWAKNYTQNAKCEGATDVAACLRAAAPEDFYRINFDNGTKMTLWPYTPMIDGDIFPQWFGDNIKTSNFNHVPTMIGMTNLEVFLPKFTDEIMNCPLQKNVEIFGKYLKAPFYKYRFEHSPLIPLIPQFHTSDLPYVFGTSYDMFGDSERENVILEMMMSYWSNFAKTGNPNGSGLKKWPKHDRFWKRYMRLKESPQVGYGSLVKSQMTCILPSIMHDVVVGEVIKYW